MTHERIAFFALELLPGLADVTAGAVVKTRPPQDPDSLTDTIHDVFDDWKLQSRDKVSALCRELFPGPCTPWSEESCFEAGRLLYRAFATAMETGDIWDRRLSPETISSRMLAVMYAHIRNWFLDRGL